MKKKSRNILKRFLAGVMACALAMVPITPSEASENEPASYTVEFNNVTDGFLCNGAASEGPITLTYTVASVDTSGGNNGVIATSKPVLATPYNSGSMRFNAGSNQMMQIGKTYSITMQRDSSNKVTYTLGEGTPSISIQESAGAGDSNSQFFGIYMGATTTAKLVNVTCVDSKGNNLGLRANNQNIAITKNGTQPKPSVSYTVEFNNVTSGFFCNAEAANGPIILTYTVETLGKTSGNNGMVATTTATGTTPYTGGSMKSYTSSNQMLVAGQTYSIQMEVNPDPNNAKGLFTDCPGSTYQIPGGHGWNGLAGDKNSKYFGIYIAGATTVRLTNVTCVDLEGNDLGLQSNQEGITIKTNIQDIEGAYTVEFNNVTDGFLCNGAASEGPITLTYTVASVATSGGNNGVIATSKPVLATPYNSGSMRFNAGSNQMMQIGKTYSITMQRDSSDNVTYTLSVSSSIAEAFLRFMK